MERLESLNEGVDIKSDRPQETNKLFNQITTKKKTPRKLSSPRGNSQQVVGSYPNKATILAPRKLKQASEVVFVPQKGNITMSTDSRHRVGKL